MTDTLVQAIKRLQESVHDSHAFQESCEELAAIIKFPKDNETNGLNLTTVTTDSVIGSMVSGMENFSEDEKVQESACYFMAARSLRHPNKHNASQSALDSEIRAILAAMKRFPNSFKIQSYGSEGISNFNISDHNRIEIVKNGGLQVLLHVVDTFGDDPDCARFGFGGIARLHIIKNKDPALYSDNLELFKQGIERVPDKLITHSKNGQVGSQLMLALFNMRFIFDWNKMEMNHLKAFLSLVNDNLKDTNVQKFAIYLFIAIGENKKCADLIVDIGGIQTIVSLIYTFFKDPSIIMDNAIYFLSLVAKNSFKGNDAIVSKDSGAIEAVLCCMEKHFKVTVVQNYACEFLCNITNTVAGRRAVAEKGGIPILLSVMREYYDCGQVQINGIKALSNMFAIKDIREKYCNDNLVTEITQRLSKYTNNPTVIESIKIIKREETREAAEAVNDGVCSFEVCNDSAAYQWMHVKQRKGEQDTFACSACRKYENDSFSEDSIFTYDKCSCRNYKSKQVSIIINMYFYYYFYLVFCLFERVRR